MSTTARLLARSNFVLTAVRDRLGEPAEGVVKYGMARAFNGAVFHLPDAILELLFFEPSISVASTEYLVRRPEFAVRATVDPGAARLIPAPDFVRLVEEADRTFDQLLQE